MRSPTIRSLVAVAICAATLAIGLSPASATQPVRVDYGPVTGPISSNTCSDEDQYLTRIGTITTFDDGSFTDNFNITVTDVDGQDTGWTAHGIIHWNTNNNNQTRIQNLVGHGPDGQTSMFKFMLQFSPVPDPVDSFPFLDITAGNVFLECRGNPHA